MGFLRNRLLRRFSPLARLSDIALVAGMGLRVAQRMGWVSPDAVQRLGLPSGSNSSSMGITDLALAGFAAVRLLRGRILKR